MRKTIKEEEEERAALHQNKTGHLDDVKLKPVVSTGFIPPDGGWGWVVCFASFWTNGCVFGIINTFGIIYVEMRDTYAKNDPEVSFKTSWVGSVGIGMTFMMCIVASILSDRIGIRKTAIAGGLLSTCALIGSAFIERLELLYLTYGVLNGIGAAFCYSPSLVILGHYFKKRMGLVNGIVSFGSAVFTIALTFILKEMLPAVGLRYILIFYAGLFFAIAVLSLTWKPLITKDTHFASMTLSTESIYEHCDTCCTWTRQFLNVRIWKNRGYVIWVVASGLALFGYFVPFVHLVKHTDDVFPGSDGSLLVMCLSITSGVARILFGFVADLKWANRLRMYQGALAILGITTSCIPFSTSFGGLIGICLVMGICDGIFVALIGPIAFDIVGPRGASQAIGFILGAFSIPFMLGPPAAGWMYDHLGSYKIAFHVAGTPPVLGALFMFFIPTIKQSSHALTQTAAIASISNMDLLDPNLPELRISDGPGPSKTELIVIKPEDFQHAFGDKELLQNGKVDEQENSHIS